MYDYSILTASFILLLVGRPNSGRTLYNTVLVRLITFICVPPISFASSLLTIGSWLSRRFGSVIVGMGGEAGVQISSAEWLTLSDKAAIETQSGVCIWIDMRMW